ncbi:MAG: DUF4124 domain-containing protein [Pseudomonadota bacterium]|nr:DUF4124 domain-containing protein [Pseudomonadota bacterium]
MARPLASLLIFVAAAAFALPAAAQWKWRDKGGHTQYSDLPPPPGTADQDILARPTAGKGRGRANLGASQASAAASAGAAASGTRVADAELEARRKKAETDAAAKTKADEQRLAAARAENCSRARGQMRSLESGIRIARTNEKGEREILDDAARAAETKRTQDMITADCR